MEQAIEFAGGQPGHPGTMWKTPEQGAATSVMLAGSPLLVGVSGRYFDDCQEATTTQPGTGARSAVASYAIDPGNAERLWTESLRLLGERAE